MVDIAERVAIVEQVAASAHKRADKMDVEIDSLRDSRHSHSNMLQKHNVIIGAHTDILSGIESAVKELTKAVFSFKIMALTAIFMGGGFVGFCGFVGGKLLHWW